MSAPSELTQVILQNQAERDVITELGTDQSTFKIVKKEFDESTLKDGDVLVKLLILSNDPTQRAWIQKGVDPKRMYVPPVKVGEAMGSLGIAQVVSSKSSKWNVGDIVSGKFGWGDYYVANENFIFNKVDPNAGLPLPLYLGPVGMTGLTAYFGLTEILDFKEGQTLIVSAASGATGSMVVQLAKNVFKAKKVIAICGSDDKCKWVKSLGADIGLNYKSPNFKQELIDAVGDEFVDAYFDAVGGSILSQCMSLIKPFGKVAACGAISGYNDQSKYAVTTWYEIITNRLTVRGFIVGDFKEKFAQAIGAIVGAIKQGQVSVTQGIELKDLSGDSNKLEKVPAIWNTLFTGKGEGKLLTKLA
ncbi:uncharacterized protein KQ657_003989 [Scheffersomyces spartinae]|uniref:Uncharacterized protein n=1 Tax=Scheffersomyces spartinae TaxID=45513 RepID=A0A9P8AJL0_9ASCO|nr:uncharacterized protein KQ657_003989 [Scheffersomyces spartinae]KAG7194881.1 hypothetical protein KQ657_003989 [Scheffersomyces spartinae]